MRDAPKNKAVRPSKRDIIVIDDDVSTRDQPVAKSVKREEEPIPSPDVAGLQQRVSKLENDFQRACRAARTAELRAEFAENLLDSKRGVLEGITPTVTELEKKLAEISSQLEAERKLATGVIATNYELTRSNQALNTKMAEMKKDLNEKMANLITRASDSQAKDRAKIDELTRKLAKYEGGPLPRCPGAIQQPISRDEAATATVDQILQQNMKIDHPANLFQVYPPDSSEAISFDVASVALISALDKNYGESRQAKVMKCFARFPQLLLNLRCDLCSAALKNIDIVMHFFSKKHGSKMVKSRMAVSLAAVQYWLDKLQQEPEAQWQLPQRPAAVAAVARPMQPEPHTLPDGIGHPTNIFQLCRADSIQSLSYPSAREKLRIAVEMHGQNGKTLFNRLYAEAHPQESVCVRCDACKMLCFDAYEHFLSDQHHEKVQARGAVSWPAIVYWTGKMQSLQQQQQQVPAAAVRAAQPMQHPAAFMGMNWAS